jgi:quercetin dioxygenase-like cupin family protein
MTPCQLKRAPIAVVLSCATLAGGHLPVRAPANPRQQSAVARFRVALFHALPRLDGDHLKVSVVEITYEPGGSSPAHSHPCPVIGYVVEGAVRMEVKEEPEAVYKAGESFFEAPNTVHLVSANGRGEEPAKFVAVFVCDHDASGSEGTPGNKAPGGKP